jgi:hypothetical protein
MKSIIILFHYTRCGSTVLSDILNNTSEITCFGEVYNPTNSFFGDTVTPTEILVEDLIHKFNLFFEYSDSIPLIEITRYDLIRLNCINFFSDILIKINNNFDLKIIHLQRLNAMQRIISSEIAHQSNFYHLTEDVKFNLHRINFVYNIESLIQNFHFEINEMKRVKKLLNIYNVINLSYEYNILKMNYSNLFHFLNLKNKIILKYSYQKLPPINMRISNYDKLFEDLSLHNMHYLLD